MHGSSAFDRSLQNSNIDYRIVACLQKLSEAFRFLLWEESKKTGLSPMQVQILIYIRYQPNTKATVSNLATEFNITKATVSDSVKSLLDKRLVMRKYSNVDNRTFTLYLTPHGLDVATSCGAFTEIIKIKVQEFDNVRKTVLLNSLLNIIHQLYTESIVPVSRMCHSCRFFKSGNAQKYCLLIGRKLDPHELKLDCPDHKTS